MHVAGDLAVEGREDFQEQEENAGDHGIGDDLGELFDGPVAGIEIGALLQQVAEQDEKRGTGGEGRSEKAGGHDGGEPEMAAGKTRVEEGRHGVNGNRPGDGGTTPAGSAPTATCAIQTMSERGQHLKQELNLCGCQPHNSVRTCGW